MGVYQGPSSNVTIVGSGGTPVAIVTTDGRLKVDASLSGSDPVLLLETSDPGAYIGGIADAGKYRQLLVCITMNSNAPNIDNLYVATRQNSTAPDKQLPYYELSTIAESQYQFNRYYRNGTPYTISAGTDDNYAYLLFINPANGPVVLSYQNNTDVTVQVYGLMFDMQPVAVDAPAVPFISAANSAGIQAVAIPNTSAFVSPASQYAKNVTMSTVGAPGSIAFSYDGGSTFMNIPAGALYTIAGITDLADLSFAYIAGGSTYDLKLNWEN